MADKFGRHKSTRWVRASVPSYGDEWNDDYDYDSGSQDDEQPHQQEPDDHDEDQPTAGDIRSPGLNHVVAERFVLPETKEVEPQLNTDKYHQPPSLDNSPEKQVDDKLVLSIDNLNDDTDDSDSDHAVNDLHQDNAPIKKTVLRPTNEHFQPEPPTPSYSARSISLHSQPETPSSEHSFQSDTDSIQNEPENIRIASLHKKENLFGYDNIIEEYPDQTEKEDESENENNVDQDSGNIPQSKTSMDVDALSHQLPQTNKSEASNIDDALSPPQKPDNLVLSIDHKDFNDSSDSDEDPIPYYEKKSLNYDDKDSDSDNDNENEKDVVLDSFINDLQNSSINEREMLPNVDTNDISLPDFENNYDYYDYDLDEDEEDTNNFTPIAPLSNVDEKEYHEKFVNQLSGHKPSIRKPPNATNNFDDINSSRKSSIRKFPPNASFEPPLDSPSYTTFGDVVDAYTSDKEHKVAEGDARGQERNQLANEVDPVTTKDVIEGTPEQDDHIDNLSRSSDEHLDPPELPLQPVTSSGSLSTGKFSFDQKPDVPEPPTSNSEKDLHRRDSTMSTNTFNMGAWKPNTNNFRDQFINDNDNESNFNVNLDNDYSNKSYQNFTKMRNVSNASDTMSFISNASVPETVDIALPSINEDPDDNDDTFTSSHDTSGGNDTSSQGLGIITQSSDSILKDNVYHDGKFKEDLTSKESLAASTNKQQRYASLLAPLVDDEKSTLDTKSMIPEEASVGDLSSSIAPSMSIAPKRVHSEATSIGSASTRKTFPPNAYPVSNWKTIMRPSQTIDRINLLKDALEKEIAYDTGLQTWLTETLKKSDNLSNMHIGKIASQAYQNAAHNDLRRHTSIRSRVSSVRDKVETGGLHASTLGKKLFSRSKKLMRSSN